MTEKRDESRDLLVDAYGTVHLASSDKQFGDVIRSVTGKLSRLVLARYSPTVDLESVTRERDAAVRRVAELETIAAAYRELGEAWSVCREHFRIISKPYPLSANEKLPTSIEYASASERAYSAIDRAAAFARAEKEPSDA